MNPADELRHLENGALPGERAEGVGVVELYVLCDGLGEELLSKSRDVLAVVVRHSARRWPTFQEWRKLLPVWFVDQCAAERTKEQAEARAAWKYNLPPAERSRVTLDEAWMLSAWLFHFEPERREWYWWDAAVVDDDQVTVRLQVQGWPFPWEALRWLLRAAGARVARMEGEGG